MWQTTSTAAAIKPAAMIPHSCEIILTVRMKRSMRPPARPWCLTAAGGGRGRRILVEGERLLDQLLAVRHFVGELLVRALLRDLDPGLVFRRCQRRDFDVVLLECVDHFVVEFLGCRIEEL